MQKQNKLLNVLSCTSLTSTSKVLYTWLWLSCTEEAHVITCDIFRGATGLTKVTVYKAINELIEQGLIERRQITEYRTSGYTYKIV